MATKWGARKVKISDLISTALLLLSIFSTSCSFQSKSESDRTVHLVSQEKIKGLDPIYSDYLATNIQVSQAYETLLQYHYLKRPYVLTPNLVESLPSVSPDGLVYTFRLKKGVLFQDDPAFTLTNGKGREMVAEDVVYSWKRLSDPKLASSGWWIFDGKISGLNAWRDASAEAFRTDYSAAIAGFKIVDKYTVEVKLVKKCSQFLYFLAMPYTSVIPHEAVEFYRGDFANHAVGTGPFRLSEFVPDSKIVWTKSPTFRQEFYPIDGEAGDKEAGLLEDSGKSLPLVERIVTEIASGAVTDQQPNWSNFMNGKIDAAPIPKDNLTSAITPSKDLSQDLKAKGLHLVKSVDPDVTYTCFNMADPILGKNKFLRQAMSMAYDETTFIDLFYGGQGIPAHGPIPPGIFGYDPTLKNPYRKFNLIKARELMAKAGYPNGTGLPVLEYAILSDGTSKQQAEYFEKMMAAIGVNLHVSVYSPTQFAEVIRNKKAQIWDHAWIADYPDAENFFQLFYGKNMSPGPNESNYSNLEYDQLYEKSLTPQSSEERTETFKKMVALLVEDSPWIFGAHRVTFILTQPWLKNYKSNDYDYTRYKYYRLDRNHKK